MFFKDGSPTGNHGILVKHHPCLTCAEAEDVEAGFGGQTVEGEEGEFLGIPERTSRPHRVAHVQDDHHLQGLVSRVLKLGVEGQHARLQRGRKEIYSNTETLDRTTKYTPVEGMQSPYHH
jgi:hypothetical protein